MTDGGDNVVELAGPAQPGNRAIQALENALAFARANPNLVNGAAVVLLTDNEGMDGLFTQWALADEVSPFSLLGAAQSLAHQLAGEFNE